MVCYFLVYHFLTQRCNNVMQHSELPIYQVTDGNTELLKIADLHRDDVILIDFTAQWCGPCQGIAPKIHQLVEDYTNAQGTTRRLVLCVVDVDGEGNEDACSAYQVRGMPTFAWIRNMHKVEQFAGADSERVTQVCAQHCNN